MTEKTESKKQEEITKEIMWYCGKLGIKELERVRWYCRVIWCGRNEGK